MMCGHPSSGAAIQWWMEYIWKAVQEKKKLIAKGEKKNEERKKKVQCLATASELNEVKWMYEKIWAEQRDQTGNSTEEQDPGFAITDLETYRRKHRCPSCMSPNLIYFCKPPASAFSSLENFHNTLFCLFHFPPWHTTTWMHHPLIRDEILTLLCAPANLHMLQVMQNIRQWCRGSDLSPAPSPKMQVHTLKGSSRGAPQRFVVPMDCITMPLLVLQTITYYAEEQLRAIAGHSYSTASYWFTPPQPHFWIHSIHGFCFFSRTSHWHTEGKRKQLALLMSKAIHWGASKGKRCM